MSSVLNPNKANPFLRPELIASWREIALVLLFLLVPFAVASAIAAWHGSQTHFFQSFLSDRTLLLNGAFEAAILGLGLLYLRRRGWTPADLRIRPRLRSSLKALGLAPVVALANMFTVIGLFTVFYLCQHTYTSFPAYLTANSPQVTHLHVDVSWSVLIIAMLLNAFLEEIICTAYAFNQFASKIGPRYGLLLIVLLRALCHSYQGFVHALGIAMVFLIFGRWYWHNRNLWTIILAHFLLDLASLSLLKIIGH